MKRLSRSEQDSRFLQCALALAIRQNAGGPTRAVLPLCKNWCAYLFYCATVTHPISIIFRLIRATLIVRIHTEIWLIWLQRKVCARALADVPNLDLLFEAIQAERETWEWTLLGDNWSAPAMAVIRSGAGAGIDWQDAAGAFRRGQVRIKNGVVVSATIRPFVLGVLVALMPLCWFAAIVFNMYSIDPNGLNQCLVIFGGGVLSAFWMGCSVYSTARDEKNLVSKMIDAYRLRIVVRSSP